MSKYHIQLSNPLHLLATGFGSGILFPIPGTIGSLISLILWWYFFIPLNWLSYLIYIILSCLLGVWCCGKTSIDIGIHDAHCIVWDEFIGMWITLITIPLYNWKWIIIGFIIFRSLDIYKPWPISWLDHNILGGIGILADDIVAGIISSGILYCIGIIIL